MTGDPVFSLKEYEGDMKPRKTKEFVLIANLNDNTAFNGEIMFLFDNLAPIVIHVSAKGQGILVTSTIDMKQIDFERTLCEEFVMKSFVLSNLSKRKTNIIWNYLRTKVDGSHSFDYFIEP